MAKNVLIIGGGLGGRRYCHALMFDLEYNLTLTSNSSIGKTKKLATELSIPFVKLDSILVNNNVNTYNLVVICTPPFTRLEIIKSFIERNYKNAFIIEKPLSLELCRAQEIQSILNSKKIPCFVAFNRRFDRKHTLTQFSNCKELHIIWPYNSSYNVDPLVHILPHALDMLLLIGGQGEIIIGSSTHLEGYQYIIEGSHNRRKFIIIINCTSYSEQYVKVNNICLEWPNYLETHKSMVETVLVKDFVATKTFIEDAINVTNALINVRRLLDNSMKCKI